MSTAKARTPTPAMAATTYTSNSTSASTTHSSSTTRPRPNNNNNNNNPSTPARVPEPTTALTMQPQVRTTALTRTTSLYDVYPLTARQRDSNNSNDSFLLRPSLSRTRSQHLVPATDDADDLLRSADYFQSSRSVGGGSAGLFADATTSGHVDKVRCNLSIDVSVICVLTTRSLCVPVFVEGPPVGVHVLDVRQVPRRGVRNQGALQGAKCAQASREDRGHRRQQGRAEIRAGQVHGRGRRARRHAHERGLVAAQLENGAYPFGCRYA